MYQDYNQIPMDLNDSNKNVSMTDVGKFYYQVMTFGFKNPKATFLRIMNDISEESIGNMLKIYMGDMIVEYSDEVGHMTHLKTVFKKSGRKTCS